MLALFKFPNVHCAVIEKAYRVFLLRCFCSCTRRGATLKVGETVDYALGKQRHGYLVPASGAVDVNGVRIDARDGAAIKDVAVVRIMAIEDSEVVMVDAP